jgi:hypothetical protein
LPKNSCNFAKLFIINHSIFMTTIRLSIWLAAFILLGNSRATAQKMVTYCNERFGFCVERPADFTALPAPENGDGRGFVSPDGKAEYVAFGGLAVEELNFTLADEYRIAQEGVTVTYKVLKKDWFVLSGKDTDGSIFYQKTVRKTITYNGEPTAVYWTVELKYPADLQSIYEPYCSTVARQWK